MDLGVLAGRVQAASRAQDPYVRVTRIRPLSGGASSLTFVAEVDGISGVDGPIVVKVAPPGLPAVRHRDVLRQARLLKALADHPKIVVPAVLAEDPGDPPDIPPFFTMTLLPGDSVEPHIYPADVLPSPDELRRRALQASRILAELHRLDLTERGLGSERAVSLTEEVERWVRLIGTADTGLQAETGTVVAALRDTSPAPAEHPVLQHGDYRLGNMLAQGTRIEGVIDWEIWAVGDPRVDLAWFLSHADPEHHASAICDAPGMPRPPVLLEEYERAVGGAVSDLEWFLALAQFKMAAVTSLMVKLNRRAKRPDPEVEARSAQIQQMTAQALTYLGVV